VLLSSHTHRLTCVLTVLTPNVHSCFSVSKTLPEGAAPPRSCGLLCSRASQLQQPCNTWLVTSDQCLSAAPGTMRQGLHSAAATRRSALHQRNRSSTQQTSQEHLVSSQLLQTKVRRRRSAELDICCSRVWASTGEYRATARCLAHLLLYLQGPRASVALAAGTCLQCLSKST
jgi:hypothetical protein